MAWDPLRDLRTWQERLGRLASGVAESWTPAIDVYETADAYIIIAEVPGLARDDIDLTVGESRLTIRGHRKARESSTGPVLHYHQVERGHGSFTRTFEFAEHIDGDGVNADLSRGILFITLPKLTPPPARRIEVK